VSDVWINGKPVLADKKLTTIDEAAVKTTVREWFAQIKEFRESHKN
jgi:hypothetical protein